MIEFLLKLQEHHIPVYMSDYQRMRLALSTSGKWTVERLRETFRAVLIRDAEHNEIFDRIFKECFGNETKHMNNPVNVSQVVAELKSLAPPAQEIVHSDILPTDHDPEPLRKEKRSFRSILNSKIVLAIILICFAAVCIWKMQQFLTIQPLSDFLSGIRSGIYVMTLSFESLPNYVTIVISVISVFFLLSLASFFFLRKIFFKSKKLKLSDFTGQREFFLKADLPPLCAREFLDKFSEDLGYFLSEENDEQINIERSLENRCKRGLPELIFERKRQLRQVLILEDKSVTDSPVYDLAGELFAGLEQRGITVRHGYFYDRPELFKFVGGEEYLPEDFEDERRGYLVLIFSNSQGIVPDHDRHLLERLGNWPFLFWLEIRPVSQWDGLTRFISSYIPVYPATVSGLSQIAGQIRSETYKTEPAISATPFPSMESYLRDSLPWACVCALLQPMDTGIAEKLRQQLFNDTNKEDIQLLVNLAGTFRTESGFKFSDSTTQKLIAVMRSRWPNKELLWRETLDRMLENHRPSEDSLSYLIWQAHSARNKLDIDRKRSREGAEILLSLKNTPVQAFAKEQLDQYYEQRQNACQISDSDYDARTCMILEMLFRGKSPGIGDGIRLSYEELKEIFNLLFINIAKKWIDFKLKLLEYSSNDWIARLWSRLKLWYRLKVILPAGTIKTELAFGLSKPDGGFVSESDWQKFVDDCISPRFKGLTLIDGEGRWQSPSERSKVLILLHKNDKNANISIDYIIESYKKLFDQKSVMRVSYKYHKYQDELERGSADLDIELKNREIQASEDPRELYFKISNTGQAFAFDISVHIAPTNTAIDFCGNTRADIQLIESGTVAECSFRIMANAPADTTVRGTLTFSDRTGENKSLPFSFPLTIFQEKGEFRPIANPYTVGNPVSKNSNLYFGREDAYQFIDQNILARDEHHTIVCYGLRRTGKTSLLYNISERGFSDSRLVPVMFDMQGIADEADFYLTLSEAVTEALNSPGECQDFESFKQVLRTAKKDLGDRIIVVLVDEFEELQMRVETGKISKDIFSHIRHLMQHEDRLIFLFCGTHQLEEMSADYWSIFFNTAIYIRINYLSPEDTERLIREPVQGQLTYDDLAVEQILKMTSGQPYLTQLICRTLVNDLNEKKKRNYATINDVDDAVEKIISQVDDHFSTYIWRCMTTLERLILSATAEELAKSGLEYANSKAIYDRIKETDTKKPYKETTYMPRSYMKVLDRLVSKDILAEKNVRYRFPVNLLRKWIFARHPLRQVREEI